MKAEFSEPTVGSENETISDDGSLRLLTMTYSRIRLSIMVLPVIAFSLSWFYSQYRSATGLWIWFCFYCGFAIAMRFHYQRFIFDKTSLSAQAMMAKWYPKISRLALIHGLGLFAPAVITLGNAPFEFGVLYLLTLAAIIAGNATHQTPVLAIFWRFFFASWNLAVLMVYWIFPVNWKFILPMTLMYTLLMVRHALIANRFFVRQIVLEERSIQLAEHYKVARDNAQTALAEKNQFLATASHDLRQPIHAMGMLIEAVLQKNSQLELTPLVADLKSSVNAVNLMFNSLLDLSKIEAGIKVSRMESVVVAELFREAFALFKGEATRKNISFRVRMPAKHWVVYADKSLLQQAVINLVQNALRYTDKGGVLLAARRRGANCQIEVWDTGVGVSIHEQEQIFTPYYRNENAWRIDNAGHGLGLAVVARCAKLMNATYGLHSKLAKGSQFWLQLPFASPVTLNHDHASDSEPERRLLSKLDGTCLVVEDDPQVVSAWRSLFSVWEVDARFATCAQEALSELEKGFLPSAILCDQRLRSGESGFDILRALLERCPLASGAMISGDFNSPELESAEAQGYLVLRKPLDVNVLHKLLTVWFEKPPSLLV